MLSASATPTQKSIPQQQLSGSVVTVVPRRSLERDALQPPGSSNGGRTLNATTSLMPRGPGVNPSSSVAPGSFSSELRSQVLPSRAGSRVDVYNLENVAEDSGSLAEQNVNLLKEALSRELKIKEGSENLLEALNAKKAKQTKDQRLRVEAELSASNQRVKELRQRIADAQRSRAVPVTPTRARKEGGILQSNGFRSPPSATRSAAGSDLEEPAESPTFSLAEILRALEVDGLTPEYYVEKANSFVDLFKRHPTLKYDLVWSVLGDRLQVMLLSDSREVVAAGYRMMRYAVADLSCLRKIRSLNTDYLVMVSLSKDRKADVEREQALKFVRSFLDVKNGVREVSRGVVRTIAAIAENVEDRLRSICIETLAEILLQDPALLTACGGLAPITEAMQEGSYKSPESLASVLLFLVDTPRSRRYLRAGFQLECLFTAFTDALFSIEGVAKQNAKAIENAMKSWSGLMTLSMNNFRAIESLIQSLMLPNPSVRDTVVDLLYSLLRIKPPAWASSFLAGRRLTTYGRVTTLKSSTVAKGSAIHEEDGGDQNFVEHYTALLLAIFIKVGMMPNLLRVAQDPVDPTLKRKTTLLIGEILKLSSRVLPESWNSELQLLPDLFTAAVELDGEARFNATAVVYQISSVSRTLYRSSPSPFSAGSVPADSAVEQIGAAEEAPKGSSSVNTDDATFRQLLMDSCVLGSSNPLKWNWDIVLKIIEGPLTIGKRLEEAIKASKFMKRIMSFYRPFKYKFSQYKSTRSTQKYVKVGCSLVQSLLQTAEGTRYLADNKLLRQVAECLAQCDPTSGLTAQYPMFSPDGLTDTLCGGYFAMLGVLSGDPKGLQMLERWRIFNMMYHIIGLNQRPDLIKLLLLNFDYSLPGHPRILLSKALTAGTKDMRIHATNILRKYAARQRVVSSGQLISDPKWAIQLLVTQLYDPEVEVCATAVKILEKACNSKALLEYIVECRPALDHLGEIGAPLLLRFLSTSIGYHYLDGLDYISNEMDDWFSGRNDAYVSLIEASLARSFVDSVDEQPSRLSVYEDESDAEQDNQIPPHFYRELTRTTEGCDLLESKGHFGEFALTIREHGMEWEDEETITKVKGCMWAVGNVGSMELGAPFLESTDVVEHIVKIAETHQVMSLRGTAFFVLGLISRSTHGLEILSEHGWDSSTSPLGRSMGYCLPTNLSNFFSFTPWKHANETRIVLQRSQMTAPEAPPLVIRHDDATTKRIMELIVDLGNTVLSRRAKKELLQIRQRKPQSLRQAALFRRVLWQLETHHYRLADRHLLTALFEKNVLRQMVYGDESGDEAENSSGDEQKTERQRSISDPAEVERASCLAQMSGL